MPKPKKWIGVVDYGAGNLFSVERGLRAAGCEDEFVTDPDRVDQYDAILLPGVGAFGAGMEKLNASGMSDAVRRFAVSGKPLLGVCLGMQFLLSRSDEFGEHAGLGLIPGDVREIVHKPGWPVPNIGWHTATFAREPAGTPFARAGTGADFYFIHSYHCLPEDPDDILATIAYGDGSLVAIVSRDNVHGCQFHPETSDQAGLDIYRTLQDLD